MLANIRQKIRRQVAAGKRETFIGGVDAANDEEALAKAKEQFPGYTNIRVQVSTWYYNGSHDNVLDVKRYGVYGYVKKN